MDIPSGGWLPELEMEEPRDFMNQHQSTCPYTELVDSVSSQSFKGYPNLVTRNQYIQAATINGDLGNQERHKATTSSSFSPVCGSSSNTFTISFGDHTSSTQINQNQSYRGYEPKYQDALKPEEEMSLNELLGSMELPKRGTKRNHRQAQEHVLSERKRREKLTQRFISLSALLPDIKKMDKATVLEDATTYIKQLQTRVKELEELSITGKNIIQKSTASMWRSKFWTDHDHDASSFDETNSLPSSTDYNHSGIRVRISGSNMLLRIYGPSNSSLALKILVEMERLHFIITCNSVLRISDTAALITIIAQMNEEFAMTAIDLVKCLQSSLSKFSVTCT